MIEKLNRLVAFQTCRKIFNVCAIIIATFWGQNASSQVYGLIHDSTGTKCDLTVMSIEGCINAAVVAFPKQRLTDNCLMFDARTGIQWYGFAICGKRQMTGVDYTFVWTGIEESYIANDFFTPLGFQTRFGSDSPLYGKYLSDHDLRDPEFLRTLSHILIVLLRYNNPDEIGFYSLNG